MGLIIRETFEFEVINSISFFTPHIFESIFAKIYLNSKDYVILGSIYRPNTGPLASIPAASEYLCKISKIIKTDKDLCKAKNIFFTGDLNVNLLNYHGDNSVAKFLDNLIADGQLPITTHPTRVASRTATLLDFISISDTNISYKTGIITTKIADHFPVFMVQDFAKYDHTPLSCTIRDFSDENIEVFKQKLRSQNWNEEFKHEWSQQAFSAFNNKINSIHEEVFPLKTITKNRACTPIQPWMTKGLLASRKTKEKLFNRSCRSPTFTNVEAFKTFNKLYCNTCRQAKNKFFRDKFKESEGNMRATWATLREAMGTPKI